MPDGVDALAGGALGAPWTARGTSSAYGPVPWRMRGRTLAVWYRLQDPDEARRHVPDACELDGDPVVRARFWDVRHDAGRGQAAPTTRFREAVVAFPVVCAGISGDLTTHMYADEPGYIAFGREVMGWPLRGGDITMSEPEEASPGTKLEARLVHDGREVMRLALSIQSLVADLSDRPTQPRWIGWKRIPDVDGTSLLVDQLVATGPEHVTWERIWSASADLSFSMAPNDELHFLQPREIVSAEYWERVRLTLGPGRVLVDFRAPGA